MKFSNSHGFMLLEALICVLILGTGFLGLANLQSRLWNSAAILHNTSYAYMLASSRLEQAATSWTAAGATTSRTQNAVFTHDLAITRQEQLDRLEISVRWTSSSGQQSVELETHALTIDPVDTRWLLSPR